MKKELEQLQKNIYEHHVKNIGVYVPAYSSKLTFFETSAGYDITFFGDGYDEEYNLPFHDFLDLISIQEMAEKIVSLSFQGADEGANGTKSWNFKRLATANVVFKNILNFDVQLSDVGDHNQNIIDSGDLTENGLIAKLMAKMPCLRTLTVPSAPDKSFFDIGKHPLEILRVHCGYDHQNFIGNLAESNNFPHLRFLDYTDVMDNEANPYLQKEDFTQLDNFKKLFQSQAFSSMRKFTLRNSIFDKANLGELQKICPISFIHINILRNYLFTKNI